MPQRVLLIEDEADLVETMSWSLGREGYTVDSRTNGADGLERALADPPPDLILLDLMLPDIPGTEVARQLRSHPRTRDTPLIMVTARAEEIDRVVGFELGCDDYLTKPFSMRELTLRMRAVLRRATPAPTAVPEGRSEQLTFGILRIDAPGHRVWVADEEIALTALEFRLLTTLFERRGRVQTREVLLSDVWGMNPDLTTRTVDTHVKRLREKLGPAAVHVETVRGVGYRFQDRPEDAG
ncbi:MAG: response regulator transcription factor [Deltaproteobacteria bacterium]|nr:response regulator transcription factor [Deltaproteobacteria bacterium]MCB9785230.1 response regulator transcription factor [Deltaproteobacteria bacterium]